MAPKKTPSSEAAPGGSGGSGGGGVVKPRCLVTGGSGFLGQALVAKLLAQGRYTVVVFDIRACPLQGVTSIVGDLTARQQVFAAVAGCEVVFHVATAAPTGENALNKGLMHAGRCRGGVVAVARSGAAAAAAAGRCAWCGVGKETAGWGFSSTSSSWLSASSLGGRHCHVEGAVRVSTCGYHSLAGWFLIYLSLGRAPTPARLAFRSPYFLPLHHIPPVSSHRLFASALGARPNHRPGPRSTALPCPAA